MCQASQSPGPSASHHWNTGWAPRETTKPSARMLQSQGACQSRACPGHRVLQTGTNSASQYPSTWPSYLPGRLGEAQIWLISSQPSMCRAACRDAGLAAG